jgi:hypothetical protein
MKIYNFYIIFLLTNKLLTSFTKKINHGFLFKKQHELTSSTKKINLLVATIGRETFHRKTLLDNLKSLSLVKSPHFDQRRNVLDSVKTDKIQIVEDLELHQYCGETLYYTLEYYCSHLKSIATGTSQDEVKSKRYVSDSPDSNNESGKFLWWMMLNLFSVETVFIFSLF